MVDAEFVTFTLDYSAKTVVRGKHEPKNVTVITEITLETGKRVQLTGKHKIAQSYIETSARHLMTNASRFEFQRSQNPTYIYVKAGKEIARYGYGC